MPAVLQRSAVCVGWSKHAVCVTALPCTMECQVLHGLSPTEHAIAGVTIGRRSNRVMPGLRTAHGWPIYLLHERCECCESRVADQSQLVEDSDGAKLWCFKRFEYLLRGTIADYAPLASASKRHEQNRRHSRLLCYGTSTPHTLMRGMMRRACGL